MTLKRFTARSGALACAAVLGAGGVAGASPESRTMANTFPAATKLCREIRTPGTNHPRLRKYATQVIADCEKLESTFTTATTTVITAEAPIRTALATDRTSSKLKCVGNHAATSACHTSKALVRNDIHRLEVLRKSYRHSYISTLQTARSVFWTSIHSIPGAKSVPTEAPTTPKVP